MKKIILSSLLFCFFTLSTTIKSMDNYETTEPIESLTERELLEERNDLRKLAIALGIITTGALACGCCCLVGASIGFPFLFKSLHIS